MNDPEDVLSKAEWLLNHRSLTDALALFHRAEAGGCDSDRCAAGRWMVAMLCGNFAAAWQESDAILRRGNPDPHRFWQGEDLRGKRVMLRCLHGIGDAVQFLRYAPRLRACTARVIVECAPNALELVRCLPVIDEVIPWGTHAPATLPAWDLQAELMELPYIFRSTVAELPIASGYLRLPQKELGRAACIVGPKSGEPRIGVVWSSGEWNPSRSIPFEILAPILRHTECHFWNLQGGNARAQWETLGHQPNLHDASLLADGGPVALGAFIAQLNLVITVDTLAAHLAGALNVPCFVMLQYAADWRWMVGRHDSPWYPSLRLFRQPARGDWRSVVHEVNNALAIRLDGKMKVTAAA